MTEVVHAGRAGLTLGVRVALADLRATATGSDEEDGQREERGGQGAPERTPGYESRKAHVGVIAAQAFHVSGQPLRSPPARGALDGNSGNSASSRTRPPGPVARASGPEPASAAHIEQQALDVGRPMHEAFMTFAISFAMMA